jgi:hypothetical protein
MRHGAQVLVSDRIGVVIVRRCGHWGIAAPTVERAKEAYTTEHLAEFG